MDGSESRALCRAKVSIPFCRARLSERQLDKLPAATTTRPLGRRRRHGLRSQNLCRGSMATVERFL